MRLRQVERAAGLLGVALGVAAYVIAGSFPTPSPGWMGDPASWPRMLAIITVGLSALLGFRPTTADSPVTFAGGWRGLLLLASAAAYLWALPRAGYFSASIPWLLGITFLAGERRWSTAMAASVVLTLSGYVLFWKMMVIALPTGVIDDWLGLTRLYR